MLKLQSLTSLTSAAFIVLVGAQGTAVAQSACDTRDRVNATNAPVPANAANAAPAIASGDKAKTGKPLWKGRLHQAPASHSGSKKASAVSKLNRVEVGSFLKDTQSKISKGWFPPKGSLPVEVKFRISEDGQLSDLRIYKSSGIEACDQAALKAVENAAPFRHLPEGAKIAEEFTFAFEKNAADHDGHGLTTMKGNFLP